MSLVPNAGVDGVRVLCTPRDPDESLTPGEARLVGRTIGSLTECELAIYYRRTVLDFADYDPSTGEVGRDGRTVRVRPKTDPAVALGVLLQVEQEL